MELGRINMTNFTREKARLIAMSRALKHSEKTAICNWIDEKGVTRALRSEITGVTENHLDGTSTVHFKTFDLRQGEFQKVTMEDLHQTGSFMPIIMRENRIPWWKRWFA